MSRPRRTLSISGSCAAALSLVVSPAWAEGRVHARWANDSALTIAEDRVEVGLFSPGAMALCDCLEIRLHPLWFFVLPHVSIKKRWLDAGRWHLSSRHGLAYPSLMQNLIAKEGTLGLLPPDEAVPQALMIDSALLATLRVGHDQWLTAAIELESSPRTGTPVLLDFPFLYQRFASLNAPLVPSANLNLGGMLLARLDYELGMTAWWLPLPDIDGAYAAEVNAALGLSITEQWRVAVSALVTHAKYAIGNRTHWFPLIDVRAAF